jgi:hypothetical protein
MRLLWLYKRKRSSSDVIKTSESLHHHHHPEGPGTSQRNPHTLPSQFMAYVNFVLMKPKIFVRKFFEWTCLSSVRRQHVALLSTLVCAPSQFSLVRRSLMSERDVQGVHTYSLHTHQH